VVVFTGTISRRADGQRLTISATTSYHGRLVDVVAHPPIKRGRFTARLRLPGGQTDASGVKRRAGQRWRYRVGYAGNRSLRPSSRSGGLRFEVEPG
jgi:hypothetical protein